MHFLTSCKQCFKWSVSWKVLEKGFLSPGKFWNLVFASPGKKHLNVCMNPETGFVVSQPDHIMM